MPERNTERQTQEVNFGEWFSPFSDGQVILEDNVDVVGYRDIVLTDFGKVRFQLGSLYLDNDGSYYVVSKGKSGISAVQRIIKFHDLSVVVEFDDPEKADENIKCQISFGNEFTAENSWAGADPKEGVAVFREWRSERGGSKKLLLASYDINLLNGLWCKFLR